MKNSLNFYWYNFGFVASVASAAAAAINIIIIMASGTYNVENIGYYTEIHESRRLKRSRAIEKETEGEKKLSDWGKQRSEEKRREK